MKKMVLRFTVRAFLKAALHMQIHFVIFIYKNKIIIKKRFWFYREEKLPGISSESISFPWSKTGDQK